MEDQDEGLSKLGKWSHRATKRAASGWLMGVIIAVPNMQKITSGCRFISLKIDEKGSFQR